MYLGSVFNGISKQSDTNGSDEFQQFDKFLVICTNISNLENFCKQDFSFYDIALTFCVHNAERIIFCHAGVAVVMRRSLKRYYTIYEIRWGPRLSLEKKS